MATITQDVPGTERQLGSMPDQSQNRAIVPEANRRALDEFARTLVERHRKGRERRFLHDLTREKYALHVFGGEDSQWYDVVNGTRLEIPANPDGGIRRQTNLLRPIVDNFVAHHTSLPFRVQAQSQGDRESRDRALVDTLFANHIIDNQDLNEIVAEALYIAAVYGWCPIHANWREDIAHGFYDPIYQGGQGYGPEGMQQGEQEDPTGYTPGFVDVWTGDPWTTVFDTNAKRRGIHRTTYERVFPLELVREAFGDVPGIEDLKGSKDLPSASRLQRILRQWQAQGSAPHGTATIASGEGGDEAIALICEETQPGIDPQYPRGRLTIVGLEGVSDTDTKSLKHGRPVLLHDGDLPGGRFSWVPVYALNRLDDPHGKPFVEDLDELQIARNNLETLLIEGSRRAAKPPLATGPSGTVDDDTVAWEEDAIFEVHTLDFQPGFVEYPTAWMQAVAKDIERIERDMFRIGAWQAASRGESNSGDPAAKVVALQRADDTTLGPSGRSVQSALCDLLTLAHALAKEFTGPIPLPIRVSGEEFGYLRSSYLYSDDLSADSPRYVITSGFGATPEARAQTLLGLVQMRGADGMPLMETREFQKAYPDPSLWRYEQDVGGIKERRVQAVNYAIRDAVTEFQQSGMAEQLPPEWAAQRIHLFIDQKFPLLMDDDPEMHIDGLSELTQDPSEDPQVRQIAAMRQELYYDWHAARQQAAMLAAGGVPQQKTEQPAGPRGAQATGPSPVAGGTANSNAMSPEALKGETERLTAAAGAPA